MTRQPMSRYRPIQRHLHWIIFALVLLTYLLINIHHWTLRSDWLHGPSEHLHMLMGILVLLVTIPRLWMRRKYGAPPIQPPLTRLVNALAHVTHWALYAFLVVQPVLGIAYRQIKGKDISLFGTTIVPSFVSHPNLELAKEVFRFHALIGTAFYYIIALHIAAALWHHYLRRDDTLQRMLPPPRDAAGS